MANRTMSVIEDPMFPGSGKLHLRAEGETNIDTMRVTADEAKALRDAIDEFFAFESEECESTMHTWSYFKPEQVDAYYMSCDLLGPHDEHKNSHTGARWRDVTEPRVSESQVVEPVDGEL